MTNLPPIIYLTLFSLLLFLGPSYQSSKCKSSWLKSFVSKHNSLRAKHGSSKLTVNSTIGSFAQEWADQLIKKGKLEHRKQYQYGENLFSNWDPNAKTLGAYKVAQSWYDEIKKYEKYFGKEPDLATLDDWGHFTAEVWKGTKQIGVGCAISSDKKTTYIVANYAPQGNIVGQFKDNVLKPKSTFDWNDEEEKEEEEGQDGQDGQDGEDQEQREGCENGAKI